VGRADLVLDLGAGQGVLTAELASCARRVLAVEIDPALVAGLRRRFATAPNVEIVLGDALRIVLPAEPFRVVANVPFNRTTAIMRQLLDDPKVPLARADLVVELDVAWKRARCSPSTALGAYWGAWWEFAVLRRLDASAFTPPPGTDAGLLRLARRAQPLVAPADAPAYRALVTAAFERRASVRRTLRGTVSPLELKRLGRELGFAADAPPWALDQHQWAGVYRFVRGRR
jgi:23S rRNA (adenine-N6)-dimethyltransferase